MNKNIFFLFPPGYSGSYLQWIANVSEKDTSAKTTKNPLLSNGTSHGSIRKPTHLPMLDTLSWILKNKPTQPQTFVVMANTKSNWVIDHPATVASYFLKSYPDALIVNIYASTPDELRVGALNGYNKWTTWIYDLNAIEEFKHKTFDWEGGKNNIISLPDRNWLLKNWRDFFLLNGEPLSWAELQLCIDGFKKWYQVRLQLEPNEVDSEQYNTFEVFPFKNIFNVSLGQLYSKDFFEKTRLFKWFEARGAGVFDWTHAQNYHATYIGAQENLQWFGDVEIMRKQKQVPKWLLKTTLSQAFVLEELGAQLQQIQDWPKRSTEEILDILGYKIVN